MQRRRFLAVAGAATVAGCSSGPESDGSDGDDDRAGDDGDSDGAPRTTDEGDSANDPSPTASPETATPGPDPAEFGLTRGVSLSPRSFEPEDFQSFFDTVTSAGSFVRWAGDWAELGEDEGTPGRIVAQSEQYGYEPMIDVGVYSAGDRELSRPLTDDQVDDYVEQARSFAEEYSPTYLGLGVETNILQTHDPESFEKFESLYVRSRDAISEVAPDTAVYTVFQLEWLRGERGGLWGGEGAGTGDTQWDLLDRFLGDFHGFTSYPGLVFRDPSEIPDDYYSSVADRVEEPLALTEVGWPSAMSIDGWESDEAEQAAFVEGLFERLDGVSVGPVCWLWLYDQGTLGPAYEGVSFFRQDGTPRPAWEAWRDGPDWRDA